MPRMDLVASILFCLMLAAWSMSMAAESRSEKEDLVGSEKMSLPSSMAPVEQLVDRKVIGAEGDELGKITDLMIDPASGRIVFAVVSAGGVLGLGDGTHFVPWRALQPIAENGYLLDIGKEKMAEEPTRTAEMTDEEFFRQIHQFYGVTPYWEEQSPKAQKVRQEKKPVSGENRSRGGE